MRLYQALDTSGQTVKLGLYEGMLHVFQVRLPDSPESVTALEKMDAFLEQYLEKLSRGHVTLHCLYPPSTW